MLYCEMYMHIQEEAEMFSVKARSSSDNVIIPLIQMKEEDDIIFV